MNRALASYKQEGYYEINEALRNNDDGLAEVTALDQTMIDLGAATVWRGTSLDTLKFDGWVDEDDDLTSETFTDLAFVSTTRNRRLAARKYAARGLLLEISVPAGTLGVEPDEILFEDEQEVILARGLKFQVTEDNLDQDNRVLKVKVLS